jgi:poly-gamma-glutamate synthesis protein (capsule biosynthesis protein)
MSAQDGETTLFLGGDVMTGRGIDQVLAHPGDPQLHESWMRSAVGYVALAEERNGPIPRSVEPGYIWGHALEVLSSTAPDARIVNLETAVTNRGLPWPGKGIHYRMHPDNIACVEIAGIDCCVLANNHVLDWSYQGLDQTLRVLETAGIAVAGAGRDAAAASAPAVIGLENGARVVVAALGTLSSGIPAAWAAAEDRPGVSLSPSLSAGDVAAVAERIDSVAAAGDVIVASIHWGANWGYDVPKSHQRFARALIDDAGVDVVHGHSSHHALGIEVYRDRPILYGCGDLITDYEGIRGHEEFHPDVGLLSFVTMRAGGGLKRLELVPVRMHRFRLRLASTAETARFGEVLAREGSRFGTTVTMSDSGRLLVAW